MSGTSDRGRILTVAAAAIIAGFVGGPSQAAEKQRAEMVHILLGGPSTPSFVQEPVPNRAARKLVSFNVTYSGFTPAARSAFQRAVQIWSTRLTSSVPITISAQFSPLPAGVLGSAGPNFIWRDFSGAVPGTWYPDALANKKLGSQLDSSPDILARFSSSFSAWHFGTGPAPAGKIDFTSVVLHEIGHGLGFAAARSISGGKGSVRLSGFPFIYTRFVENQGGTSILSFADPSAPLATQLRGGRLFFDSPQVRTANGNVRARIYAPSTFQPGSSYVHLDEATFPQGNANSLMTPIINFAETIRNPGPIGLAILKTEGW